MPPVVNFVRRIRTNLQASARFRKASVSRHFAAAVLGRKALAAKSRGRPLIAARLMRRALAAKAAAVRAQMRARLHFRRAAQLRMVRANAGLRARR